MVGTPAEKRSVGTSRRKLDSNNLELRLEGGRWMKLALDHVR